VYRQIKINKEGIKKINRGGGVKKGGDNFFLGIIFLGGMIFFFLRKRPAGRRVRQRGKAQAPKGSRSKEEAGRE
jgi:hypothetical protein